MAAQRWSRRRPSQLWDALQRHAARSCHPSLLCRSMKVFICYARQDADFAEAIAIRLRAAKHDVFFDRSKLEPGTDFDRQIREFLEAADFLIFLAGSDALTDNAYAQTELAIFRRRFP